MTFASPILLLTLVLPPLWWWWRRRHGEVRSGMRMSGLPGGGRGWRTHMRGALTGVEMIALCLLLLAMARPQWNWFSKEVKADAVDIMLALDISPSMLSKDFQPNRLRVAKNVLIAFVDNRPYDRIGLVAFAAEAFTQCPLTTDRRVVQYFLDALEVGRLKDGTAIGMGLATAVNRLRQSAARSKVVILVTDGENNEGYISPLQAAKLAKELGVRVYTVGIGTEGIVLSPSRRNLDGSYDFSPRAMSFDTELLEKMAADTGGKFYRAYSPQDMQEIYAEIDRLEKTKIKVSTVQHTTEIGPWLIFTGLILLLLVQVLRFGLLRTITEP